MKDSTSMETENAQETRTVQMTDVCPAKRTQTSFVQAVKPDFSYKQTDPAKPAHIPVEPAHLMSIPIKSSNSSPKEFMKSKILVKP
jgi:hypothetical protein